MGRVLCVILINTILLTAGYATGLSQSPTTQQTQSPQSEPEKAKPSQAELPEDEEDALVYRLLAAPEYLWKGFTYPIKKMSIFYEKVDLLERALDFFLNEERTGGIYPSFALGGVVSSGIGFTAFENNLFNNQKRGRVSYLFGARSNQTADASFTDPAVFGSRFKFESEVNMLNFDQGQFFPGGNQAGEQDETQFSLFQVSAAARGSRPLVRDLSGSFLTRYFAARGRQSDEGAQIPLTTVGLNTTVQAIEVEPGLRYDTRDNPFNPSTGWLLDGVVTFTSQVNRDQFRYIAYTFEAQRYIPVFRGNRILVLRALLGKQDTLDGRSIPFYELNTLDLNHGLRGFQRGRWRDQGRILFNAEWRYPVWERFDGSLFFDLGQVFRDFRDIEIRTFRYSAGIGFRFVTTQQFAFRGHIAISEDGFLALIRGDLEFLRKRGTILGGL